MAIDATRTLPTSPPVEREVVRIVSELVSELGTMPPSGAVTLDNSLDRDLGIGSLERVELLFRLEQAFRIRFADRVMGEADTLLDLAQAIVAAEPPVVVERHASLDVPAAGTAVPSSARTLIDVLRYHLAAEPDRPHIFLHRGDGTEQVITPAALWQRAVAVAAGLRDRGVRPGHSVALMLRTEEAFFAAFCGVLLLGAVPVPLYPPFRPSRLEEYALRQVGILKNAEAHLLVTFPDAERMATIFRARVPSLREVTTVERLALPGAALAPAPAAADAPALIQYTSGSTGDPKGVLLTHANILANIRGIGQALRIGREDVGVSWLPLYHDMGLIGAWLGSLYHGIPVAILSPLAFLARPARWLWALHRHRGTLSPAPNFAFDLCVTKIRDEDIEGLDLSSWRLAMNGSESVSPDTIERFTRRFGPYGFTPEAMCPVYGLAEAAVGLTVSPLGRPPRVDRVSREVFAHTRRAVAATDQDAAPLRFVSCGLPLPGHAVQIVGPDRRPVAERVEGGVEFRGPSVTSGYFGNSQATTGVLHDGWMDSGDLGYRADGELYITGRRKDMIKKAGRNLYPQELEEMVGDLPGIRKGCVAAFGVADPTIGTERLVVMAESRDTAPAAVERLHAAVRERVVAALGIPPDTVVVARPGSVLKTSSGKIRRAATRDAYLRGDHLRRRASPSVQWGRLLVGNAGERLRRLAGRGGTLLYALYVAAVALVTVPALWLAARLLPGAAVDRVSRRWCRAVLALAGCRLELEGRDNLRALSVLVANHSSYLDVVALLASIPMPIRFVAKRELKDTALIGTIIRKVGHLTVERFDISRSAADAETVARALRREASVLFFPEGTFRAAPGLLPFRLGAFKAAVEAGRPVIPIAILGTRDILPADRWILHRGPITVAVGTPIAPEGGGWREIVRLRDRARAAIATRLGEDRPEDAPPEHHGEESRT
jgi:1-acyl-sn-glycerol-3-phosphate acyltransferase